MDIELSLSEEKAIASLKRVAKKWPKSLWLFSASGSLLVMRYGEDGQPVIDGTGSMDPEYIVGQIQGIDNDGGDF